MNPSYHTFMSDLPQLNKALQQFQQSFKNITHSKPNKRKRRSDDYQQPKYPYYDSIIYIFLK